MSGGGHRLIVPGFPHPAIRNSRQTDSVVSRNQSRPVSRDGDSLRAFGSPAAQEAERAAIRRSRALTRFAAAATARAWRRAALSRIPRNSRPTRPISGARLCSPAIAQIPRCPSRVARTTARREKTPRALLNEATGPTVGPVPRSKCLHAFPALRRVLLSSGRDRWPQGQLQAAYSDLGENTGEFPRPSSYLLPRRPPRR
jgi:hypothetical protein